MGGWEEGAAQRQLPRDVGGTHSITPGPGIWLQWSLAEAVMHADRAASICYSPPCTPQRRTSAVWALPCVGGGPPTQLGFPAASGACGSLASAVRERGARCVPRQGGKHPLGSDAELCSSGDGPHRCQPSRCAADSPLCRCEQKSPLPAPPASSNSFALN